MKRVSGTEGYADEAVELFRHYESISAAELHGDILHLIPKSPGRIVDIGAGTGRDAAWFAEMAIGWWRSSRWMRCASRP